MLLKAAILAGFIALLTGCAVNNAPAPVIGVDIARVEKGAVAPFSGTIFSPFYLERYLMWKETK
jgi:hypothetical protein